MSDLPAPLDEFLNNPPTKGAADSVRAGLLRQTSRLVRRRRLARIMAAAASLAAVLLLSAVALWLFQRFALGGADNDPAKGVKDVVIQFKGDPQFSQPDLPPAVAR